LGGQVLPENNVRDPQGRLWRVVHDGSLTSGHNGELVTPILTYGDIEPLQKVLRALHAAGARSDRSTGLHVHIGAEAFDAPALVRLIKMVHKQERLIEKALGTQPTRLGQYCRPIDQELMRRIESGAPRTIEDLKTAWYGEAGVVPQRYSHTRYRGLNLNSYFYRRTIEIRAFEGTTHAGELKACIQFALALAAKALTNKSASGRRRAYEERSGRYDFRVFLLLCSALHKRSYVAGGVVWCASA
jgi:hypothetical protein